MQLFSGQGRVARLALVFALVFAAAACAKKDVVPAAGTVAPGSPQDFVVNVGDRVYFTEDSSDINAQAAAILDRQAQWLTQYNRYTATVEGHADERGTREYNLALGARRANSTRAYLVSRGINPARLRVISYGKERPVAVCDNESCWTQNRRAVTVLNAAGS